jgi:pilus assembly protein Flp/PilA
MGRAGKFFPGGFPGGKSSSRTIFQYKERHKMEKIKNAVTKFVSNEEGAALAEYGILIAFIAIVAIVAVTFFGSKISAKFSSLANSYS